MLYPTADNGPWSGHPHTALSAKPKLALQGTPLAGWVLLDPELKLIDPTRINSIRTCTINCSCVTGIQHKFMRNS